MSGCASLPPLTLRHRTRRNPAEHSAGFTLPLRTLEAETLSVLGSHTAEITRVSFSARSPHKAMTLRAC